MTFEQLRDKAHSLPREAGVYLMQDKSGTVIYVGKAKSLRNRVSQYFQESGGHSLKTRVMVGQIVTFDVIIVKTEFDALVLESSLIKRHQPKYNILLKDSKGYPYIKLTVKEDYPKFSLVSKVIGDKNRYFGPFGSRHTSQAIIHSLLTSLSLPTCSRKFPRDIGKERPCLNLHMGQCLGHCRPQLGKEVHDRAILQATEILDGKFKEVLQELQQEMEAAAAELRFEQAGILRDRIQAISLLGKRHAIMAETHVIGFYSGVSKSCFVVLKFAEGNITEKDMELIPTPLEEEAEVISSLIREYYGNFQQLPRQVLLPCELEDQIPLTRYLSELGERKVELITPQRGAKTDLVELAHKNAKDEVERITSAEEYQNKNLILLGKLLHLSGAPHRIESFDISNTGNTNIVGGMVVFEGGKPKKSAYRKFKVKDLTTPDDYASMRQVLTRRFQRFIDGDNGFAPLPDLLLIDGGQGHVNLANEVLISFSLNIPVFGMVKDHRHRTKALVTPEGEEIGISQTQSIFALIGQIQEETHRTAITFQRQLQNKTVKGSLLDDIVGVGEVRRTALLKHFRSLDAIKKATLEELETVVPKNTALAVFSHFHSDTTTQQPTHKSKN
ncbi:MAG: excinuclease ABC subunit UvrC [Eubacteriales bacterium]